jgi:hypothetical protein
MFTAWPIAPTSEFRSTSKGKCAAHEACEARGLKTINVIVIQESKSVKKQKKKKHAKQ